MNTILEIMYPRSESVGHEKPSREFECWARETNDFHWTIDAEDVLVNLY
jgi:hypothetical protein